MRERNVLLVAAGFAPVFPERSLDDPFLGPVRDAIDLVLRGYKPFPAFALDRRWNIVATNNALPILYDGVGAELMRHPINALRLSLHPDGLAPRIANLAEWRSHLLHRLRQQIDLTADPDLSALLRELSAYPAAPSSQTPQSDGVVVPFRVHTRVGLLSFLSTTMVFGTPVDITLSELAIEAFLPADQETASLIRGLSVP
jgi:transcription regulator MmyB-like protein